MAINYFRKTFPLRCFEALITFFEGLQSEEKNVFEPDFFVVLVGSQKDLANFYFSKIFGLTNLWTWYSNIWQCSSYFIWFFVVLDFLELF